eukprot:scaffold4841_cov121-Isochrysis_galbana.AAC.12
MAKRTCSTSRTTERASDARRRTAPPAGCAHIIETKSTAAARCQHRNLKEMMHTLVFFSANGAAQISCCTWQVAKSAYSGPNRPLLIDRACPLA